jgi:seryl-tRNA synthetase
MNAALIENTRPGSRLVEGLIEHGLLLPTSALGVWGRGATFERVVAALERAIDRETRSDEATWLRFPPVIPRRDFEKSGFLKSFPHLAGAVHAFPGDPTRHQELLQCIESGGDWSGFVEKTDTVLTPAACYPIYATLGGLVLPQAGRLFDVASYCFRHEPSADPGRMIAFRMREQVRAGTPDDVVAFREHWILRAQLMFSELQIMAYPAPANDPFFGRGGRLLAVTQREERLKFELLVSIDEQPTAVMSFNYHQDHFGRAFGFTTSDGALAHTACVGFGLERITLALFHTHGFELARWPDPVLRWLAP